MASEGSLKLRSEEKIFRWIMEEAMVHDWALSFGLSVPDITFLQRATCSIQQESWLAYAMSAVEILCF